MIDRKLAEAIRKSALMAVPVIVTEGKVTAVNKNDRTCDVDRDNLPDLPSVRLNATLDPGTDLVTIYPKIGSKVLCIIIENQPAEAFLLTATDIEEISVKIQGVTILVNKDEIKFNGGENGGLAKTQSVTDKLNVVEKKLNDLISVFNQWAPVPMDGGAALKTVLSTWVSQQVTETNVEDISNEKIKH